MAEPKYYKLVCNGHQIGNPLSAEVAKALVKAGNEQEPHSRYSMIEVQGYQPRPVKTYTGNGRGGRKKKAVEASVHG